MTKYDPRKNAEGYNDPTPYAAEKHMMAQIRGKQARVAGGYFENIISASCDYYLSRGLAKIEKTPEPMKPLGAIAFVLVSVSLTDFYRVPWPVWRDMAEIYGRKYMTHAELSRYEVPATAGFIKFLHGIEEVTT